MMNKKIGISLILLSAVIGGFALYDLPSDIEIATRWNLDGEAVSKSNPIIAFSILPIVQIALLILFAKLPLLEPREENLQKSRRAVSAIVTAIFVFLSLVQLLLYSAAKGIITPGPEVLSVMLGALFMVLGNYLGKLQSTFFIGIRTPWTLSSETVWRKTHRVSGKIIFVSGLITLLMPLFMPEPYIKLAFLPLLIIPMLIAIGLSWFYWRQEQKAL